MSEIIDVREVLDAVALYGKIINSPTAVDATFWRFRWDDTAIKYQLWVEKTLTHYKYDSMRELLDALKIKTLLHERWAA